MLQAAAEALSSQEIQLPLGSLKGKHLVIPMFPGPIGRWTPLSSRQLESRCRFHLTHTFCTSCERARPQGRSSSWPPQPCASHLDYASRKMQ